ncbi:hypothetical protein E1265_02915 [Streptomyces sp. 8K308]|uniref:DUF6191 domain-containing protein n=1 Tax=Streptomyces sp. 8K308 TaxID=2530388 RepID=UPI0010444D5C|nr:DUF6191 domain-containing protein [Streptomyces sp. 8K308]TDC26955.1 hypothetical protein E1265_02915 [Streptomyces sp. 8K308]
MYYVLNVTEELFLPGSRHTHAERKRLELSKVEEGTADPGRGPIDLDSGRVLISLPPAVG